MEDWSVVHKVSLLGFLGALVFGAVANKTHFCIMGSISDWINMGSRVRFRGWMLSIGIAILGSQAMVQLGWVDFDGTMYRTPIFGWAGFLIGGLLFGAGMTLGDIDIFEVNEAFASVVLSWAKTVGADMDKVNPNGGAIALGHPLGASGTKLMATLLNALKARGKRYGLQTMCEGGGMANATIIERLDA